jgi:hypothetical protein
MEPVIDIFSDEYNKNDSTLDSIENNEESTDDIQKRIDVLISEQNISLLDYYIRKPYRKTIKGCIINDKNIK